MSTILVVGSVLALLLAAGALYQFIGARRGARRYAAPGMMIDVDGQHLHVLCSGNGWPTVLFESGIAASSLSWASVLRDVATFTRACAYDRAGLGWSDPAKCPRTIARCFTRCGECSRTRRLADRTCWLVTRSAHSWCARSRRNMPTTWPASSCSIRLASGTRLRESRPLCCGVVFSSHESAVFSPDWVLFGRVSRS